MEHLGSPVSVTGIATHVRPEHPEPEAESQSSIGSLSPSPNQRQREKFQDRAQVLR